MPDLEQLAVAHELIEHERFHRVDGACLSCRAIELECAFDQPCQVLTCQLMSDRSNLQELESHTVPCVLCKLGCIFSIVAANSGSQIWLYILISGCQFSIMAVYSQLWLSILKYGCIFSPIRRGLREPSSQ